ncbi:MAG TPA: amino acid deaminase [Stellaceae bacterium]|nr:amino acid deaminase [Stellaceae bacterium]
MEKGAIDRFVLDQTIKGMPGGVRPFRLDEIGRHGWNVLREDLPMPLAVLKESALRHNGHWMRAFLERSGAVIAPHGKTTMSPQLFERQLADGAWAITVATAHQLQVARQFGIRRVVLANQLIGRQAIRYVLDELRSDPTFDFYCLVDSKENIAELARCAEAAGLDRPLQLLIEGGFPGGRAGCRTVDAALEVARAIGAAGSRLSLRGVEGFEGLSRGISDPDERERQVSAFLDFLVEIAVACERAGLFSPGEVILSAGGSKYYDMVTARFAKAEIDRDFLVVTRSGCYLTHDSVLYRHAFERLETRSATLHELGPGLIPALEVWAYVQSRPESAKVILTLGQRDISTDNLPVALTWLRRGSSRPMPVPAGHQVTGLNDQHCHMTVPPDSPLAVGDLVCFGISHPCLTFDKWQVICVVDDDYNVVSAIRTFF